MSDSYVLIAKEIKEDGTDGEELLAGTQLNAPGAKDLYRSAEDIICDQVENGVAVDITFYRLQT